jgi:hypothetical protein
MRARAEPYLVPKRDAVNHAGWHLRTPLGEEPLRGEVIHWDYQTRLSLVAAVSVDRRSILADCGLDDPSVLEVQVFAHSSHTNAREMVASVRVPPQSTYDLAVEIDLFGQSLGGRLTLETLLVVQEPIPLVPIAARRSASILWRQSHHTHLEGEGARFPTDAYSFVSVVPESPHAMWKLTIDDSDPERSFMACVRLALNTDAAEVQNLLAGTSPEQSEPLVRTIRWDVLRQLIYFGLRSDWIHDVRVDSSDPSLAGVIIGTIWSVFPHDPPSAVRARLGQSPHTIESAIQEYARLAR